MFIDSIGHYLPGELVSNEYFADVNGLSDEWIFTRTGIKTRTKAKERETTNTMGIEAVRVASQNLPYNIKDVDLIIGASYTPYDTIGTIAHTIQREFNLENAKSVYVSSACSSLINALEIVEGYFASGKSERAIVVASEQNSLYNDESNEISGHLWGDGAACLFLSKKQTKPGQAVIKDIYTKGLGHIGRGTEGVYLHPTNGGLLMPFGKDVFVHACNFMIDALELVLKRNNLSADDLDYIIPHQANVRIINHIKHSLNIPEEKMLTNIEELGNTGCASTLIVLSQNIEKMIPQTRVGVTVFGGGYSCGSLFIQF
jgi:3-oxoacyl-[acyl-carrier-protein] synthase III